MGKFNLQQDIRHWVTCEAAITCLILATALRVVLGVIATTTSPGISLRTPLA